MEGEEFFYAGAELAVFRRGQIRVGGHQLFRCGLGFVQQPHIAAQVGDFQTGQAVLTLPEEITGAPDAEILFGDLETVIGFCHHFQAAPGLLTVAVAQKDAVGLCTAPANARPSAPIWRMN